MNRQVRRAEEKKERKQEREKEKAKAARRARRRERAAARSRDAKAGGSNDGKEAPAAGKAAGRRGSDPGRFSGALMIATVFFMVLQAITPSDGTLATQLVSAAFYLLFGYFAVLWLMRRGADAAIPLALGIGAVLWIGTGLSQWLQPTLEPALWTLVLAPPLLVAGAFLGRLVYRNAPR